MSTGDFTNKTCTSENPCQHRLHCNGFWGCDFGGYCDFMLPRDSRVQPLQPPTWDLGATPRLRNYFAGQALCKMEVEEWANKEFLAKYVYEIADAMISQRGEE